VLCRSRERDGMHATIIGQLTRFAELISAKRFATTDLPGNPSDELLACAAEHGRRWRVHVDVPKFTIKGDEALANAPEYAFDLCRMMTKLRLQSLPIGDVDHGAEHTVAVAGVR
jgi:hypothetical protein